MDKIIPINNNRIPGITMLSLKILNVENRTEESEEKTPKYCLGGKYKKF